MKVKEINRTNVKRFYIWINGYMTGFYNGNEWDIMIQEMGNVNVKEVTYQEQDENSRECWIEI